MGLCEQCHSMTETPLAYGRNSLFRHDHITLRKAVFVSRCFVCTRVWHSLTEEQKSIASDPAFEGIEDEIYLSRMPGGKDGEQQGILANMSFQHGDDLYDCEDYNVVGGPSLVFAGCFAILNPSSAYTLSF